MSINAKNLSYESREPAFLRRLRNEAGGQDSIRHGRQLTRPKKQKQLSDEDDDAPTYVDEESHDVVPKNEFEALINRNEEEDLKIKDSSRILPEEEQQKQMGRLIEPPPEAASSKEQIASVGAMSKKRLAKVVGNAEFEQPESTTEASKRTSVVKIKKDKRIKLSFDE